ncbi:GNAT family N-acetyltransferase [Herbiconiux sp. L3-i23]|uniref:GNAT family N-acetyltransferase n=1 Tax=Herbiconiux sp. L3-i23 TaxID=2905871 RepID=UPI002051D0B8|nr:GNAT family N-acetyltransferase [Herbiconiux sp. L3-i23]BDI21561.1 N-acetyltransferase GCN5 [Herbiconiux sp. L3-i23]
MRPTLLRSARLVLDQPTSRDVDDIALYCSDPLFDRFMALPNPYRRDDAEHWVTTSVPTGWENGSEFSWAIREHEGGPLIGAIGSRVRLQDVGYWMGEPFRRRGYMTEALRTVTTWLRAHGTSRVHWECVVGNVASARAARAAGYLFTGTAPSTVVFHDGSRPLSWHGEHGVPAAETLPWPAEVAGPAVTGRAEVER